MFWCRCRVPTGCCSLGSSVFSGHLQISLLVWPLDWWDVPYCMDVVGSHFWFGRGFGSSAASFFGRFVTAPSSCASYTPSILGVGRVVMYSESLISDLPWWVQSCYIFCGLRQISLLVPPWFWLLGCLFYGRFVPALSSCASALLFGIGVWCWYPTACFMTCISVDGVASSFMTVVSLTCGSDVISARALPTVWPLRSYFLLLRATPFLSDWGLTCGAFVRRLYIWLALVGTMLIRLVWPSLALTFFLGRGFGSRDASCQKFRASYLFLRVSPSLYYWDWTCVAFSQWISIWLVLVGTVWFPGCFVLCVSFLFYWRCDSAADRRCWYLTGYRIVYGTIFIYD